MAKAELSLENFIKQTENGQLFTVEFIKRGDDTLRMMNCRRGVKKGVTGKGLAFNPADYALLVVFDMQKMDPNAAHNKGKSLEEMEKGAFRMINLDSLVSLRMAGKRYNWNGAKQAFIEE